jgi:transcriptional regulator with XRE-family HTH domain
MTRKELAEAADMSRSMTDAVVSGRRIVDQDQEPLIEKALGIPAGRLRELDRALMKQAQELYSDALRRAREETYHLLPRSWRDGPDLKVVATKE